VASRPCSSAVTPPDPRRENPGARRDDLPLRSTRRPNEAGLEFTAPLEEEIPTDERERLSRR
jgi:hypothetical protein